MGAMQTGVKAKAMQSGVIVAETREERPIDKLLEWAYRDQKADLVVGLGAGLMPGEAQIDGIALQGSSACGCVALGRIAELGYRIDGGGGPAGHLHVDAERLHESVMRLPKPIALLIIRHARQGSMPETYRNAIIKAKPVMNGRGKPTVRFDVWDQSRNFGWCPVEYTFSLARIEAARMEYQFWWDGIALVAEDERLDLVRYRAALPSVDRAPWENSRSSITTR